MTKVSVARLKAELSRFVAAAKQGEEVLITERGRPVARLVAVQAPERASSRRERLAQAGLLRLGTGRLKASWPVPTGRQVGTAVLRALLEERSEGR